MVTINFHQKLMRSLEMYLLKETDFKLNGISYDLVLLIPTEPASFNDRSTLLISAKSLNEKRERSVIQDILTSFKSILNFEEFTLISSLKVINNNSPLVKNINFTFPFQRKEDIEYEVNTTIGGVPLHGARLVRSSVLPNLIASKKCGIKLSSGHIVAGRLISINENYLVSVEDMNANSESPIKTCQFSDIVSVHSFVGDN